MSNIIDRLYSQEVEETKLYSTGSDMLDELLTKAYCDGYEDAQKEFGDPNENEQDKNAKKKCHAPKEWLEAIKASPVKHAGIYD